MARQPRIFPQNLQERLMPQAQFEALEACCQVRHDWSINSDKSTVKDNNDNNDAEEAEDPQGDPTLVKTRICEDINMFKRVLLLSQRAVEALYNDQMITTLDLL
jgi:hypothetical protein